MVSLLKPLISNSKIMKYVFIIYVFSVMVVIISYKVSQI
jgi:hypothetical protein